MFVFLGGISMRITLENLNEIDFENEDARLLITEIVYKLNGVIHIFDDKAISLDLAIQLYNTLQEATGGMGEITEGQMNHKQLVDKEQMISNFITELSNRNLPSPKFVWTH